MRTGTVIACTIGLLAAQASQGAAALLHTSKSVTLDAPASKVWKTVKDFDALNTWHPAVDKDQIVEGTNDKVGAVRLLTLKNGGTIKEKLLAYDPKVHSFRYTILEGVLPVSSYTSSFTVVSAGKGRAKVTWSGRFKRKDPSDSPATDANDQTALDTINGVYQSGLDNLKKMVESP
jgi:mxaD protein